MRAATFLLFVCVPAAGADVAYTISTVAGGTFAGDGLAATAAQLGSPEGLAFDAAGNLYVSDALDHRIRRIGRDGLISTVAGDGYPGDRGDGGPAAEARLNSPYGLAFDRNGNLYVADLGNGRLRRIAPDGRITTIARFVEPRDVATDGAGHVFVSDFADHRVYRISPNGLTVTVAGTGAPGAIPDAAVVDATDAPLRSPAGLAVDAAGRLYIADSGNGQVRVVERGRMTTLSTGGIRLYCPLGVAERSGRVAITDKFGNLVVRIEGGIARVIAGNGEEGYTGDGGAAADALVASPRGALFDRNGALYITHTVLYAGRVAGVVRRVSTDGEIATLAGDGTYRPAGDGADGTHAHLDAPTGLAVDAAGAVYIADRWNHRVRKLSEGVISTVLGNGEAAPAQDGLPAEASGIDTPTGVAADSRGALWVAEQGAGRLVSVSHSGIVYIGADGLSAPEGLAADGEGNVYIADTANNVVRRRDRSGTMTVVAGSGAAGYSGDGGSALDAELRAPMGVAADSAGRLFIADTGNHAVRRVDSEGRIETVAGTGFPAFGGDGGPAALAALNLPAGLAVLPGGALAIADAGNHRVRRVSVDGGISTIAGDGVADYGGDGGPAARAQLKEPVALAVDTHGAVYVADRANNRVRKLTPAAEPEPAVQVFSIVNAASMRPGPVAPGELVTLFGAGIGPVVPAIPAAAEGRLPASAGGVEVLFDSTPAPLLYVQSAQINLQAPYSIAGRAAAQVEVRIGGEMRVRFTAPAANAAPGVFTYADGRAIVVNSDSTLNSEANPAARGTAVTFYATGEGETSPGAIEGTLIETAGPVPVLPVQVRVGGARADVVSARLASGCAGLLEVIARVPESAPAGVQALELTIGGARSQGGLTVAIR